ncbi:helix-turn-helix domain-containing protein [Humidesulfovibrio idahonensis]
MSQIGKAIARLRRAKGLNQTELANQAGGSRPLVSALERGGAVGAGLQKVERILAALGHELAVVPKASPPTLEDLQKMNEGAWE